FLDALRTAPPSPLPGPALTADRLGDVLQGLGPHRASGERE
ncbi:TetR/AcrR family transcriptional regulator, partial [Streptomyces ipomoeae]|nr:TetR/AcrR family transcriptional regulator [Streptomyces ipomoeae]